MKNNSIPKGLVPLEELFDTNDVAKNLKISPDNDGVEYYNIGFEDDPKVIKLSKDLDPKNRNKYIALMTKFSDVFAWTYEDLKEYNTDIIQHTIPIKENEKPFRQAQKKLILCFYHLLKRR